MSASSHAVDPQYSAYLVELATRGEDPALAALREATRPLEMARMQISPEQGRFMTLFAAAMGVRRAIEVGVFTGYSALCVAQAMPQDGRLVALDVSEGVDAHCGAALGAGRRARSHRPAPRSRLGVPRGDDRGWGVGQL
jgi:predicted O-methyltransferase YrrM